MPSRHFLFRLGAVMAVLAVSACDTVPDVDPPPVDPPTPVDPPIDPPVEPPEAGAAWVVPEAPVYPLRVAASGRHLVDATGRPLLLHGDAGWSAIVNLRPDEQALYLADRRRKGFNAVYVNLIEWAFSNQTPRWRSVEGHDPFTATVDGYVPDLTRPNEPYWQGVDAFLRRAEAEGIVVIAFPAYTGWQQGFDGWAFALHSNGLDRIRSYGAFLGRRYAGQPNLIWAAGGDWGPSGQYDLVDDYRTLFESLREQDGVHLWTGHGGQESGVDVYGYLGLDLNTTYRYPPASVPEAVYVDYARAPTTPFVFFEGWYENEWGVTTSRLRFQAYAALLGGAGGQFYGNNPVWLFGDGWEAALDDPGALDMVHVGDLFRSRPFHRLVPDYAHETVPEGRGDRRNGTYLAAARTDDGATVIAYAPSARPVEVVMDRISGAEAQAWCFDPASGSSTDLGRVPTSGRRTFQPCVGDDWVLVLDDASRGLGAPGQP